MEDDEDILENQVEFLAERNIWNRIGGADIGLGLGGAINLKKSGYTIEEKFKLIVLATINVINDLDIENMVLSSPEITHVLSLVEKIPDFQYKNPSAFVLGYIVAMYSDYKTLDIDESVLEICFQINKEIEDNLFTKIENDDIIRYTRLCLINKIK
jgi:Family of unknown function (DUF5770)